MRGRLPSALLLLALLAGSTPLAVGAAVAPTSVAWADESPFQIEVNRTVVGPAGKPIRIVVTPALPTTLTLLVRSGEGAVVRRLAEDEPVSGAATFAFDGRRENGKPLPDGTYRIVARDAESAETETVVQVDGTKPGIRMIGLTPTRVVGRGPIGITVRLTDRRPQELRVRAVIVDAAGKRVDATPVSTLAPGRRRLTWKGRVGKHLAPNGSYGVRITAVDEVGNARTGPTRWLRVERPVHSLVIRRVEGAGGKMALTFDDCGIGSAWSSILDTIQRTRIGATFFCTGFGLAAYPTLAKRTAAMGIVNGNHTWGHPDLRGRGEGVTTSELIHTSERHWQLTQRTMAPYFRPPYGSYDAATLRAAGRLGYRWTVLWDVDPQDWATSSAGAIANHVVSRARSGSIIVLHTKPPTARALPGIIRRLRAKGLTPVSLPDLLAAGGRT